jgi:ribosomal protein S18 acetylase RimI-like enzyme
VKWAEDEGGYVVWRRGTGGNVELLHLRAAQGHGRRLLRRMLDGLASDPPYCTVFGFTRVGNVTAQGFYKAMGFTLTQVAGVYADGSAVVFSQTFEKLKAIHGGG